MEPKYDGEERRKDTIERDRLLTKIDVNLENLIKTVEAHVKKDEVEFKNNRKDIVFLQKVVAGAGGALFLAELILKWVK